MTLAEDTFPSTVRIVEVKIRNCGDPKKMGAGEAELRVGDHVMLEADGTLTYGVVTSMPCRAPFIPQMRVMKSILRPATAEDNATIERHERLRQDATVYCRERAGALGLEMKLVEVYCSFQRREMTFVYTAETRIDFRQLVRDLARRFGGRIEMRQIGSREEAKRLGGVDSCGLVLCCAAFMTDFTPVSVKKARATGLDLSENRLIGICGRLKCCLMFEEVDAGLPIGSGGRPSPLIRPDRPAGTKPPRDHGRPPGGSRRPPGGGPA